MVRKFLDFLYKETNSLNQAALLLGFFAFLSQALAFLRDRLLAHIFGASATLDVYYAAFRIPDLIFVTVASVVSLSVLIPFIIERESQGHEELRKFINSVFSFFSLLIISVAGLAYVLMPFLSGLLFKGFDAETLVKVVTLSRLMLLSPIILGFSNLFGSVTQAYNRFTIYALSPILYNAGIIFGIILLAEKIGVLGVAIGVVVGASLHALIQVPFVFSVGLFPKPSIASFDFSSIKKVVRISLPRTMTLSMTNISSIFLVSMASLMIAGSVSILSFSFNLQSVLVSIIGVSYSLAAFPTLSRRFRDKNMEGFRQQMATTTRLIIFWSLPLMALFIVLRAQIVRVVLGSGLFDWEDTRLTAAALALFVVSSMFQSLMLLFMRGFYSAGHTRKPFLINFVSMIILMAGTWGLIQAFYNYPGFRYFISALLKVEDLPGTAVLMLPLGFSAATILNTLIHWFSFEREFPGYSKGIGKTVIDSLGASVIMGVVAHFSLNLFVPLFSTDTLWGILLQGVLSGILAIIAGIIVLILLKSREFADIWSAFHHKFWKTKVIATDPEIV